MNSCGINSVTMNLSVWQQRGGNWNEKYCLLSGHGVRAPAAAVVLRHLTLPVFARFGLPRSFCDDKAARVSVAPWRSVLCLCQIKSIQIQSAKRPAHRFRFSQFGRENGGDSRRPGIWLLTSIVGNTISHCSAELTERNTASSARPTPPPQNLSPLLL